MLSHSLFEEMIKKIEDNASELFVKELNSLGETIVELYDMLKAKDCISRESMSSSPGDKCGWVETSPQGYSCLCLSDFNCTHYNYVIIFLKNIAGVTFFDCYKYYDEPEEEMEEMYKKYGGHLYYVKNADILLTYTDNVNNNKYINRPNLNYIMESLDEIIKGTKYFPFEKLFSYINIKADINDDKEKSNKTAQLCRSMNEHSNSLTVWKLKDISIVGNIATRLIYFLKTKD